MSLVVCFLEYSVVLLTLLQRFSRQSAGIAIAILFITSHAGAVAKYCDEYVRLCAYLSVREDIAVATRAIFTN